MFSLTNQYWKHAGWVLGVAGAIMLVAGGVELRSAFATIPPHGAARLQDLAARTDGQLSEASLERFGQSLEPGALALAQRYAPPQKINLADGRAPSEASYDNDPGPLPEGFRDLTKDQAAAANAAVAFSKAPNPAADPFKLPAVDAVNRSRAQDCLTMAVYYEAASESPDGQAAVAQVVLNRLRDPIFPKTVCGVVFEGSKLPTGCQFSFTCDGSLARQPSKVGWKRAQDVAVRALGGYVLKSIGEATHYHTMWVVPYWQPSVVKLTQIGAHIFYRWPGEAGLPSAFHQQYAGVEEQPPAIPGFVGDTGLAVLAAANATPPPAAPAPVQAPTVELADLTVPKAAPVVQDVAPPVAIKPTYFAAPEAPSARKHRPSVW